MQARLKSPVQTDATLLANISPHCWELLRPFACHVAKSLTGFKLSAAIADNTQRHATGCAGGRNM